MTLKTARLNAQLSQRALAKQAGVDNSFISRVEAGERSLSSAGYAAVVRIAAVLGVDPGELVAEQVVSQ